MERVPLLEVKNCLHLSSSKVLLKNLNCCTQRGALFGFNPESQQQSSIPKHRDSSWPKITQFGAGGEEILGEWGRGVGCTGTGSERAGSDQGGVCPGDFAPGRALPTKGGVMLHPAAAAGKYPLFPG